MRDDVKNSTLRRNFSRSWGGKFAMSTLLAVGLAIAAPLQPTAQARSANEPFVSGESFWVMCTSTWGHVAYLEMYAACRAYVAGIADVLGEGQAVANNRACFGEEASKGRATEAVIAWMRAHPERKGLSAVQITATALAQKYPCSGDSVRKDKKNGRDLHLVR